MPWYRCTLEDPDREVTITLDVLTNADGIADRGLIFFGYYRDNAQTDNSPFAVTFDGKVDWGSAASFVGTLAIHGKKIARGAVIPYASYQSNAAMERGELYWGADLIVEDYRNHAD
jgi:hypothetical protein